jgi:hypothetical protein
MSLLNKTLLFPNVLDMFIINELTGETMFTGNMTKDALSTKGEKLEIFAGMDNEKIVSLNVKKEMTFTGEIADFNLNYFAYLNGVSPDVTTKKIISVRETVAVTTASATVTGALNIYSVETIDGVGFKVVTTTPTADNEVKIDGTTLTFKTASTLTSVLVTYEKAQTEGKEAVTIKFSAKAFPTAVRIIAVGKIYDSETEEHVADAQIELYRCSAKNDWDISMDLGKSTPIPVSFDVLTPKLVNGSLNVNKDLGRFIVKEL